jgi:hypothetical protein
MFLISSGRRDIVSYGFKFPIRRRFHYIPPSSYNLKPDNIPLVTHFCFSFRVDRANEPALTRCSAIADSASNIATQGYSTLAFWLQLSLWWPTSHPSPSSRSKLSSAAWQQTPSQVSAYWSAWQILMNFLSCNFNVKLFACKSCSLLTHEALILFIWRCATEHSSSCL